MYAYWLKLTSLVSIIIWEFWLLMSEILNHIAVCFKKKRYFVYIHFFEYPLLHFFQKVHRYPSFYFISELSTCRFGRQIRRQVKNKIKSWTRLVLRFGFPILIARCFNKQKQSEIGTMQQGWSLSDHYMYTKYSILGFVTKVKRVLIWFQEQDIISRVDYCIILTIANLCSL